NTASAFRAACIRACDIRCPPLPPERPSESRRVPVRASAAAPRAARPYTRQPILERFVSYPSFYVAGMRLLLAVIRLASSFSGDPFHTASVWAAQLGRGDAIP